MHALLACLCNSRIVQPAHAGDGSSWPLLLIWGGQLVLATAGVVFWLARRRSHRSAASAQLDAHRELMDHFVGALEADVAEDLSIADRSPVGARSGAGRISQDVSGESAEADSHRL